jgi:hypothetical protein
MKSTEKQRKTKNSTEKISRKLKKEKKIKEIPEKRKGKFNRNSKAKN